MKKIKYIFGIILLILAGIILLFHKSITAYVVVIAEPIFSSDGHFDRLIYLNIRDHIVAVGLILTFIGFLVLVTINQRINNYLYDFFFNEKIQSFFLDDSIISNRRFSLRILLSSVVVCILLHIFFLYFGLLYSREGDFLEWFTAILFLIAAALLLISILKIRKITSLSLSDKGYFITIIGLLVLVLVLFFGEEISWGQWVFKWETTGIFKSNIQEETNIHNFFNPAYKILYPYSGIFLVVILMLTWISGSDSKPLIFNIIFPHPSLFFIALFLMGSGFEGESELFEQLMSVMLFLYSIRVLYCVNSLKVSMS